jgi:DNA repair exonuclease SbcCD ATPase subunit
LDSKIKSSPTPLSDLLLNKKSIDDVLSSNKQNKIIILTNLSELDKSIQELKRGFLKCPICDTQLSKEEIQKKSIIKQEEVIKKNQALENINKEIDQLKQKEDAIDTLIIMKKENELIIKNLEDDYLQNTKRQTLIQLEISSLAKSIDEIKEDDHSFQKIKDDLTKIDLSIDLIEKKENKSKLSKSIFLLEQQLKNVSYNEEEYIKINSNYLNLENSIISLTKVIQSNASLLENLNKQIIVIQTLKSQKKEQENLKEKYLIKKQDLSNFIKSIEISQHQLRKVLIDNINDALAIIWPKVYPYKDYLSARLRSDNDYILEVQTKAKEWTKVEGFLSGGERACAALSIRIAIALILTKNLGLLILDEPTHNLDTKSVEMLSTVLEEDIPQYIPQTIIITHDTKLLETISSQKYIIERDKENDGISEIKIQ